MKTIGLTGGTGSGKSTVASILRDLGARIIDADKIAREVVQKGEKALEDIVSAFGREVLLPDGELDRKKLGSVVFTDPDKLKVLNSLTHPYIISRINREIAAENEQNAHRMVVIDAALLVQSKLHELCDQIWVVVASDDIRRRRIMERDAISNEHAHNRIEAQMPQEALMAYAAHVIENNGDLNTLRQQVEALIYK